MYLFQCLSVTEPHSFQIDTYSNETIQGKREFLIGRNESWSIWRLLPHGCDHPGNISEYTISITPLPEPICEPIPEGSGCYPKGSSIAMPNMLGMTSSQSVYTGFEMFFGFFILFQSCHEYLKAFLCYYGYPKCEKTAENVNRRILPCKQFCEEVTQACQKEFGVVGIPQLVQYKCPLLPNADDDASCFFPIVDCFEPSANNTNGGKWIYNSTIRGSKAHLVCPSGHRVSGTDEIQCHFSGKWTVTEAECIDQRGLYAGIACSFILFALLIVAGLAYKWRYEIKVLVYNRFHFRFRKQKENETKEFDAFISYNIKVN